MRQPNGKHTTSKNLFILGAQRKLLKYCDFLPRNVACWLQKSPSGKSMNTIFIATIALFALAGALFAEREFFVFDNGLTDIKSPEEQAVLLKKLADRPNLGTIFSLFHFLCQEDAAELEADLKALAPHLKLISLKYQR